jgi:hypothetical protein
MGCFDPIDTAFARQPQRLQSRRHQLSALQKGLQEALQAPARTAHGMTPRDHVLKIGGSPCCQCSVQSTTAAFISMSYCGSWRSSSGIRPPVLLAARRGTEGEAFRFTLGIDHLAEVVHEPGERQSVLGIALLIPAMLTPWWLAD